MLRWLKGGTGGWSGRGSRHSECVVQHIILARACHPGKQAEQRAQQEIGSVSRCGGGAHARINDCPCWWHQHARYLNKRCGQLGSCVSARRGVVWMERTPAEYHPLYLLMWDGPPVVRISSISSTTLLQQMNRFNKSQFCSVRSSIIRRCRRHRRRIISLLRA